MQALPHAVMHAGTQRRRPPTLGGVSTLPCVSPAAHPRVWLRPGPRGGCFSRRSSSMQRSQPGHLTKSPHPPTTSVGFLRICNDIDAASPTDRSTLECGSLGCLVPHPC
eukprot:366390-Chlamydomonas_euryale.AAC.32